MANVVPFAQREVATDLQPDDIDAILNCIRSLPGEWGAKFVRVSRFQGQSEANWGYVFPRGPVDDTTPTMSITRTTTSYTVVSWDLLEFAAEGSFAECRAQTIGDVLAIIREITSSFAHPQCHDVIQTRSGTFP
jgi:hypothetical protein